MTLIKQVEDFQSPNSFSQMIECLAINEHEGSVMTAITSYCETQYIDVEDITKLFSKSLLDKIKIEARGRRLLIDKNLEELPFI